MENLVAMDDPHGVNSLAAILRSEFLHDPYGLHDWKALLGNAVDVVCVIPWIGSTRNGELSKDGMTP